MNMQSIREIAKKRGLKIGKLRKAELIRTIQLDEGNYACFATESFANCEQMACLWREDCEKMAEKA